MTVSGILHREVDRLLPLLKLESTDRTFIDVGANAGFVSLLMASSRGNDGDPVHVHCFEPKPVAFDLLMANVSLNAFDITVNNTALGAKAERATLTLGADSTGSSLAPGGFSYIPNTGKQEVEVMTLDDYCEKKQILPDVVKVDVEGHEPYVLQGGRKILSAARPYLIVEINSKALRENGSSANGLLTRLGDLDYRVFRLDTDMAGYQAREAGTRKRWNGYPEVHSEDLGGECLIDVVGVPN
jgi:FkbM family methyltransferase